jgi:hypothetical protein
MNSKSQPLQQAHWQALQQTHQLFFVGMKNGDPNLFKPINNNMRIRDIIRETTAGAVAGVATGLGGGDPEASIYKPRKKKKQKKTEMIRRVNEKSESWSKDNLEIAKKQDRNTEKECRFERNIRKEDRND